MSALGSRDQVRLLFLIGEIEREKERHIRVIQFHTYTYIWLNKIIQKSKKHIETNEITRTQQKHTQTPRNQTKTMQNNYKTCGLHAKAIAVVEIV